MRIEEYTVTGYRAESLSEGDCIYDIETTGHYWQTSALTAVSFAVPGASGEAVIRRAVSEKEADEYDLLVLAVRTLDKARRIITYNGTSFDIPHTKKKLEAYGLPDPFPGKAFLDLYPAYRPLGRICGFPSMKLQDLAEKTAPDRSACCDAERTLQILPLSAVSAFFDGAWEYLSAEEADGSVIFRLRPETPLPVRLSLGRDGCYLIASGSGASCSLRIFDGKLRLYHEDVENYDYLPAEGYAVHRSMSVFVEASHKEKAVPENCFSLISYSSSLLLNEASCRKLISSALRHIRDL